jgi:hypothetical protein
VAVHSCKPPPLLLLLLLLRVPLAPPLRMPLPMQYNMTKLRGQNSISSQAKEAAALFTKYFHGTQCLAIEAAFAATQLLQLLLLLLLLLRLPPNMSSIQGTSV